MDSHAVSVRAETGFRRPRGQITLVGDLSEAPVTHPAGPPTPAPRPGASPAGVAGSTPHPGLVADLDHGREAAE